MLIALSKIPCGNNPRLLEGRLPEEKQEIFFDAPFDRLDFIIENHSQILIRGPLLEMAKIAEVQVSAENAQSRGLIHDCFHKIYCYYADNLISGDAHFQALKDHNPHPAFEHIILTQQIEKIWKLVVRKMQENEATSS